MVSSFQAAVLQFRIDIGDVEANVRRASRMLRAAADEGASLCVLPEMWSTGFCDDRLFPLSATTPQVIKELARLAGERRMAIAGSLPERARRSVYNTLYIVDRDGEVAGAYRKTHLFSPSGEHLRFRRGTGGPPVRTSLGPIGPLICYDIRFPEIARRYFLEGARLLCVSAQWPAARRAHWELLAAARAVENQCFVVAANATGPSGDFRYDGGSVVVAPTGERLAEAGDAEGFAVATIEPKRADDFRRRIPCAEDRNERAYRTTRRRR